MKLNAKKSVFVACSLLLAATPVLLSQGNVLTGKKELQNGNEIKADPKITDRIVEMLRSSVIAPELRGAELKQIDRHLLSKDKFGVERLSVTYRMVGKETSSLDQILIIYASNGAFDLVWSPKTPDVAEEITPPNWSVLANDWDEFVQKHWPEVKRVTRIEDVSEGNESIGTTQVTYEYKRGNTVIQILKLSVGISDGLVHGISFYDVTSFFPDGLPDEKPSAEFVKREVIKEVASQVKNIEFVKYERHYLRGSGDPSNRGFVVYTKIKATKKDDEKSVVLNAVFDERNGEVRFDLQSAERHQNKKIRDIIDEHPFWNSHTDELLFITARSVKGRPHWQRNNLAKSVAVLRNDKSLSLMRFVKREGRDYSFYEKASISSDGRWLSVLYNDALVYLNIDEVIYYHLKRELSVNDSSWLRHNTNESLLSLNGNKDSDIFALQWKSNPESSRIIPIAVEDGEDTLPTASEKGNLSWAKRVSSDEEDTWLFKTAKVAEDLVNKAPVPPPGKFVDAAVAIADENKSDVKSLVLPSKPLSIAWSSAEGKWLVVTKQGLLWISDEGKELKMNTVADVSWRGQKVVPVSAAISRNGNIAIAAELTEPLVQSNLRVLSLVFNWDGRGSQLKLSYEPFADDIERYKFSQSGTPWAQSSESLQR